MNSNYAVKSTKSMIPDLQCCANRRGKYNPTFMILTLACGMGFLLTGVLNINLGNVLLTFPWGVLVIYISMDLFTQLLLNTGVMERIAIGLAQVSKAKHNAILILFGILLDSM